MLIQHLKEKKISTLNDMCLSVLYMLLHAKRIDDSGEKNVTNQNETMQKKSVTNRIL